MKSRTQGTAETWSLDGDTITVFIPMTWKRRGGRKVIIAPGGGDAWAPAKARLDETLICASPERTGGSGCWKRAGMGRPRKSPKPKRLAAASSIGCCS